MLEEVAAADDLVRGARSAFIANLGQWRADAAFIARFGAVTARLDKRGWSLGLRANDLPVARGRSHAQQGAAPSVAVPGASIRMAFLGGAEADPVGEDLLPGVHNYFLGADPARWRTDVPRFSAVRYRGLYPGVEVRVYERAGLFEYDVLVRHDADLRIIELRVEGATQPLRLSPEGALVIETAVGHVIQARPSTHQVLGDGSCREVSCQYELRGGDRFGFSAAGWERAGDLVVDPGLQYSSYLGGTGNDHAYALAVDRDGVVSMAGQTWSSDFPTTLGAWDTSNAGNSDAFVTRLDPRQPATRQLVYSTFLGGASYEWVGLIETDPAGVMTLAGSSASPDFPTTPGAWSTRGRGGTDVFLVRLDHRQPGAQQLLYSTLLGGSTYEEPSGLDVDVGGIATFTGWTDSGDFPTTSGAWSRTRMGQGDAFLVRLDPTRPTIAQLTYSTFLGGSGTECAWDLSTDATGVATIVGNTYSTNFPTTPGAWDVTHGGGSDAFVTRIDPRRPASQQLVYSTLLGGLGYENPWSVSVDRAGVVTIAGDTSSLDFPTTVNAYDRTYNGGSTAIPLDAFVARLDPGRPTAQQLVYSTYFGGTRQDRARTLSVDTAGVATIGGVTESADLPTTIGAWDTTHNGGADCFVARLDPSLSAVDQLLYSTYLGGSGDDWSPALCVDQTGTGTLVGQTLSHDYPTTVGAWDTTANGVGTHDAFVTRLDLLPGGVATFGGSTPGCTGHLAIGVTSSPHLGNASFGVTCNNAPRSTTGALLIAERGLASPFRVLGVDAWLDPRSAWLLTLVAASNDAGAATLALPLPSQRWLVGFQLKGQFVWASPNAPAPCPPLGFSTSNALSITIQP